MTKCNVCTQRVLSHSLKLTCFACKSHVHIQCLPNVNRTDSIYTDRHTNRWLCTKCSGTLFPFNNIDDDAQFKLAILETHHIASRLGLEHLECMEFNPFEINDDNAFLPSCDADPDLQYYNDQTYLENVSNCKYYTEDTFSKLCDDHSLNNCFSIVQLNIRSTPKNLGNFENYLGGLNHSFTVIGISETWLNDTNKNCYSVNGYNHIGQCRGVRPGGGVSLYVKNSLSYSCRSELNRNETHIECIFIELSKSETGLIKDTVIGMIYRPPNQDIYKFNESLAEILQILKQENKLIYLMGDFNINLLDLERHLPSSEYLDSLYSYSLFPLITKPTRITHSTSTLIDNIFLNDISLINTINGILFSEISDHFPIFTVVSNALLVNKTTVRKGRIFSSSNMKKFKDDLRSRNWNEVMNCSNGPVAFDLFYKNYCDHYDRSFPIQTIKSNYSNKKPWLSQGLKNSIKRKNKLYIKQLRNPTELNKDNYKIYKRELNRTLRIAERSHYEKLLLENKKNSKKLWSILKDVINQKKAVNTPKQFIINDKMETSHEIIANTFNKYFTNIGNDLAEKIPETETDPVAYIKSPIPESIYLSDVDCDEVVKIIKSLKNASAGYDGVHANIVKESYPLYIEPLVHVLNLSIRQGFFPNSMKVAKVIPLYKSGDAMKITNYRPVSILPLFSKILERLMYNRLMSFINKHKVLYKYQFGFRKNYSANMALILLVDKITSAIEKGEIVLGVFLDFQKAFDTVNHSILLQKLFKYGIRGTAYLWLQDYIRQRQQFVSFINTESSKTTIKCGVPQGSILGPLLFLLYINDLANTSQSLMPMLFADDTNIFLSGRSLQDMVNTMNNELQKVVEWLKANKLSLNVKKTHFMVFRSHRRDLNTNCNLQINGVTIEKVDHTKFLGVVIDSLLSWQKHVSHVKGKIARGLGIICRAKKNLNPDSLLTLYYSIIYPHLIYCVEVWGNACAVHITSLFKLQKKAVKMIRSVPVRHPSDPLFREMKLLKLSQIHSLFTLIFIFKFLTNLLPDIFDGFFVQNRVIAQRNTRQVCLLHIPRFRTSLYSRMIKVYGVKLWNEKCANLERHCSVHTYKKKLKHILINEVPM